MSDSGDSASTTAAVDAIDWGDPPLDLPNFFFEAERSSVLDYVGTFLKASIQQMYPRAPNYDDNIVADLPIFWRWRPMRILSMTSQSFWRGLPAGMFALTLFDPLF